MRTVFPGFLALTLLALWNAAEGREPGLAGTWAPHTARLGGADFPVADFGGAVLRLTEMTYEFANDQGSYVVNPNLSPATMDITGVDGPNAGRTIPSIYRLAGDTLTICYALGGGPRPTSFASPPGSQFFFVEYRRVP